MKLDKLSGILALVALLANSRTGVCVPGAGPVMSGTTLHVLENGLRVLTREQHGASLVAMDLWVRAGSGEELPDESGAAHFMEHLLFKGTPTMKPGEIDAAFEDLGSSLQAATTRDGAHFFATVTTPYVDRSLGVLADAIQHPTLDAAEMERERAVILDELARGRNDWQKQAVDSLRAALYPGYAYGRPVLGLPESIRTLSRQAVAGFHERLYRPNNATLVLVGDLSPEAALAAANRAFGSWRSVNAVPRVSTAPPVPPAATLTHDATGRMAVAAIGFRGPEGTDTASVCAADILVTLLADPAGGRLADASKGLCAPGDVSADYTTLRGPGVIALYGMVAPGKLSLVQQLLDGQVRRIAEEPVTAADIAWARRRTLGTYLYDVETYAGQARMLGFYDMVSTYEAAMNYKTDLAKVTAADVAALCKRFLDPDHRAQALFVPAGSSGAK